MEEDLPSTLSTSTGSPGSPSYFQSPQFVEQTLHDLSVMLKFLRDSTHVEDLEAVLLSTDFGDIMYRVSELPIYQRRFSSCFVMKYLLPLLKNEDLRGTVFNILEIFSNVMVHTDSFSPRCLEVIVKFIVNLESEDENLCKTIIQVLFSRNFKFWKKCEMVLLQHQLETYVAHDCCRLVTIIYSVDSSITVNIINNITNMMTSRDPHVKECGIEFALKIFTSEHSGFSSGFFELWKNLCASLKDRNLDLQLMTGFITELLVKQPRFRRSYLDVLSFYVSLRRPQLTIHIYKAITEAVLSCGSIFPQKVQKCAVISLAAIYRWTLFCNYSLTTQQEKNWKKDTIALLDLILVSVRLDGVRASFRDKLKGILYKYLVPTCIDQATRVNLFLRMWLNVKPTSRSTMKNISYTSYRVRNNFLAMFYSKKNVSLYATRLATDLRAEEEHVRAVLSFLRMDSLFNALLRRFLESVSAEEAAESAENILVTAREKQTEWTLENLRVLHTLLQYLTNNLFDGVAVTILMELIHKIDISHSKNVELAVDLLETVIIENPVIALGEEVLEHLDELENIENIKDKGVVKRIFRRISTIPGHLLLVDKQNGSRVSKNRGRRRE